MIENKYLEVQNMDPKIAEEEDGTTLTTNFQSVMSAAVVEWEDGK